MSPIASILPACCSNNFKIIAAKLNEENEGGVNRALRRARASITPGRAPAAAGTPEDASDRRVRRPGSRGAGGASARPIEGVREGGGAIGGVNSAAAACGCGLELRPPPERRGPRSPRSRRGLWASWAPSRGFSREPSLDPSLRRGVHASCAVARFRTWRRRRTVDRPTSALASVRGMVWPISFSMATMDFWSSGVTMEIAVPARPARPVRPMRWT